MAWARPYTRFGGAIALRFAPMNLSFFRLGLRTLVRDLRAGELRLLIVAVTLAVAALTSVGFFADRLQGGLQRDALQLLGGDAVVASDNPTPPAFAERARALGLQTVTTMGFPTMGRASDVQGGATKLVALKSVEPGYPLRGSLQITGTAHGGEAHGRHRLQAQRPRALGKGGGRGVVAGHHGIAA